MPKNEIEKDYDVRVIKAGEKVRKSKLAEVGSKLPLLTSGE